MAPIFFWFTLWNPAFSQVATLENLRCFCHPEKYRVNFTGYPSDHFSGCRLNGRLSQERKFLKCKCVFFLQCKNRLDWKRLRTKSVSRLKVSCDWNCCLLESVKPNILQSLHYYVFHEDYKKVFMHESVLQKFFHLIVWMYGRVPSICALWGRLKLKFQEFHPSSHLSQRCSTCVLV